MVRERDAQTLERIIADHIPRNTVIFSDSWPAYQGLRRLGYPHYQVNHSKYFIDIQDELASPGQAQERVCHEMELIYERGGTTQRIQPTRTHHILFWPTRRKWNVHGGRSRGVLKTILFVFCGVISTLKCFDSTLSESLCPLKKDALLFCEWMASIKPNWSSRRQQRFRFMVIDCFFFLIYPC